MSADRNTGRVAARGVDLVRLRCLGHPVGEHCTPHRTLLPHRLRQRIRAIAGKSPSVSRTSRPIVRSEPWLRSGDGVFEESPRCGPEGWSWSRAVVVVLNAAFDVEVGEDAVEAAWQPPVGFAGEQHQGWDED